MTAMEQARAWWFARSVRERWMLSGLGLILVLVVFWYGLLTPLRGAAEAAADRRARAATALAMTEDLVRQNAGARPGSNRSLSELVDATATAAGVAIDRRREDAGGRLTVWVGAVEPASLMQWILALRKTHGVAVTAFAATKADAASLGVEISFARTTP